MGRPAERRTSPTQRRGEGTALPVEELTAAPLPVRSQAPVLPALPSRPRSALCAQTVEAQPRSPDTGRARVLAAGPTARWASTHRLAVSGEGNVSYLIST